MKQSINEKPDSQWCLVIAEGSAPIRQSLVDLLSDLSQKEVVGTIKESFQTLKPNVLALGIHMPGGAGWPSDV